MGRGKVAGWAVVGVLLFASAFTVGFEQSRSERASQQVATASASSGGAAGVAGQVGAGGSGAGGAGGSSATSVAPPPTTAPCDLSLGTGPLPSVPVDSVCSSAGAPHFATPQAAMTYLAAAWNRSDVRQIDFVTSPAGRQQMDAMAAAMVNLSFRSCTANPNGDYTCFFNHDIAPPTSPTTYPNPYGYPVGEAVFTVAPAAGPGWYLTQVIHCG